MSWLSRFAPSFFSASNDNTLALASVKFDFSLVKVEAPVEFNPLGMVLSRRRKTEAEDGSYHKTARRLGALFEQLMPSTPKLLSAYGKRVSEIINTPGINPQGGGHHGPFQAFIGADATAMWAAATSGSAAITVYLLACLLARAWEPHEATSIWVELVEQRKRDIMDAFANNHVTHEASVYSARQDITREDLARWDASARSWLRSADQVKAHEKDQAKLILHNLPYPNGGSTYEKVIQAWFEALVGLEELLNHQPRNILNGSVPLAILVWHLYPDLIVFGSEIKKVRFNDELFAAAGSCTVGLEPHPNSKASGTEWSLALSHLTFYGDAQVVRSRDRSRMTIKQFAVVVLGSLLATWSISEPDLLSTIYQLRDIWQVLEQLDCTGNQMPNVRGLGWLEKLAGAALTVIRAYETKDLLNQQLMKFGWRRGRGLLQKSSGPGKPRRTNYYKPLFGLCDPSIRAALTEPTDLECGIRFPRDLSEKIGLEEGEGIIIYFHKRAENRSFFEVATARPLNIDSGKRNNDGHAKPVQRHYRSLVPCREGHHYAPDDDPDDDSDDAAPRDLSIEMSARHQERLVSDIESRLKAITNRGEQSKNCIDESYGAFTYDHVFLWRLNPKPLTSVKQNKKSKASKVDAEQPYLDFRCLLANETIGLFMRCHLYNQHKQPSAIKRALNTVEESGHSASLLAMHPARLYDYLSHISTASSFRIVNIPGVSMMGQQHMLDCDLYRSLIAFDLSYTVFDGLPNATVTNELVTSGNPLCRAPWLPCASIIMENDEACLPEPFKPMIRHHNYYVLSRSETFGCLLHYETGLHGFTTEYLSDIFAISVDNSLYVAEALLSDPSLLRSQTCVRHLAGNIGRSGISPLVEVKNARVRKPSNDYSLVRHEQYDFNRENNYRGTSLHLSFTGWSSSLDISNGADIRTVDTKVCYVESVISLRDHGKHISDLRLMEVPLKCKRVELKECQYPGHGTFRRLKSQYISIDDWEELLDPPIEGTGIIRAKDNWAARLAAVSVLLQMQEYNQFAVICGEHFCLNCLEEQHTDHPIDFLID